VCCTCVYRYSAWGENIRIMLCASVMYEMKALTGDDCWAIIKELANRCEMAGLTQPTGRELTNNDALTLSCHDRRLTLVTVGWQLSPLPRATHAAAARKAFVVVYSLLRPYSWCCITRCSRHFRFCGLPRHTVDRWRSAGLAPRSSCTLAQCTD